MRALLLFLCVLYASPATAEMARRRPPARPVPAEDVASRNRNRFGLLLGAFEPLGSIVGINVAYNVVSFARVTAGAGWFPLKVIDAAGATVDSSFISFAMTLKLFVPGWSFSPYAGGGFTHVNANSVGTSGSVAQGFITSATKPLLTFGLDWQMRPGFQISLGAHVFTGFKIRQTGPMSAAVTEEGTLVLPHGTVGWFFDWLNY